MKIKGEILEVKTRGDSIEVRAQGCSVGDAAWREKGVYTFIAPLRYQAAFHVGRNITIKIEPV